MEYFSAKAGEEVVIARIDAGEAWFLANRIITKSAAHGWGVSTL